MAGRALVTGAGGFIGHHLVKHLVSRGYWVRGADLKLPEYEASAAQEFEILDLRRWDNCLLAARGVDEVYHLAADMGGIGYITYHHGDSARNNVLASTHMLEASRVNGVSRFFFASSACVYPQTLQGNAAKPINRGASMNTRCQTRPGSSINRHSHSNPLLLIQVGARRAVPLRNLKEAPAPTATGTFNRSRCSYIHLSCLGAPNATHRTSGADSLIRLTTDSSSSGVNGRKGGA